MWVRKKRRRKEGEEGKKKQNGKVGKEAERTGRKKCKM